MQGETQMPDASPRAKALNGRCTQSCGVRSPLQWLTTFQIRREWGQDSAQRLEMKKRMDQGLQAMMRAASRGGGRAAGGCAAAQPSGAADATPSADLSHASDCYHADGDGWSRCARCSANPIANGADGMGRRRGRGGVIVAPAGGVSKGHRGG